MDSSTRHDGVAKRRHIKSEIHDTKSDRDGIPLQTLMAKQNKFDIVEAEREVERQIKLSEQEQQQKHRLLDVLFKSWIFILAY